MSNITNIHDGLTSRSKDEQDMLAIAALYGIQQAYIKIDPVTQLHAIIAIHSTRLGPALGGCRCIYYATEQEALIDAVRLAQSMSYKSAIMGLPYGGGKAVLMKPDFIPDRVKYFHSFGQFVQELGGQYITAVDVGTSVADMDAIASQTQFVTSTSSTFGSFGDPAPFTALGVFKGIQAAVSHKFKRDELQGLRVIVQGVGHVGYHLAKLLSEHGALLSINDLNADSLQRCVDELQCQVLDSNEIYSTECDIYAPCALGGTINKQTIDQLHCSIVAGAANNQLLGIRYADMLHERGIVYAPDYVINSGGLIKVAIDSDETISEKIDYIYDLLLELFKKSHKQNISPARIADREAELVLYGDRHTEVI